MPDMLEARERNTLKLLLQYTGTAGRIRYRDLRKAQFPEKLAELLQSRSEYLDSLASREFQSLAKKGWLRLDGTGMIEVIHKP
jgi:hypothetical protein